MHQPRCGFIRGLTATNQAKHLQNRTIVRQWSFRTWRYIGTVRKRRCDTEQQLPRARGAALVAMLSGLTIGRKKYAEVEAEMQAVRVMAEKLRAEMTQAVDDDAASFEAVIGAFKLPKETEEPQVARTAAIQRATLNAVHIPLHSAERSVKIMELAVKCAEHGNLNAISDALSGFAMSGASLTAAAYNVRINIHSLPDKSAGDGYLSERTELEKQADTLESKIRKVMKERGGI